jgi:putative phosphoesterase
MKIAVIADIHGNIHALEAVLEEIEQRAVDRLIVNGDIVNRGPNNVAVMKMLESYDATLLLGNHDDLICKWVDRSADLPAEWFEDPFWKATAWTARQLAESDLIAPLRDLPMTYAIELDNAPTLLFSHGSPRHYREGYGPFLESERLEEIVQLYPADILIGSHTHRPYHLAAGKHVILNTGAVGAPFNRDARAQYLILELDRGSWRWAFHAVAYDHAGALAAFEETGFLEEGDLSAFIFWEELRFARPIYAPYWHWAESERRPMNWESWQLFREQYADLFVPPRTGTSASLGA